MRFSDAFGINRTEADDWFDPHLSVDTKLFVDPLLLLLQGGEWEAAHQELLEHFVHCYRLVARAESPSSVSGKAVRRLLTFPEPAEFCLGYTAVGTRGLGSGDRFSQQMADGIAVAIARGLTVPEHIEEIGILNQGIGADRISDAVCNVLKHHFITYTQSVARRHNVPLNTHLVRNARVFPEQARWLSERVALPTNPISGRPVILVPEQLLNTLPVLNADDWFESTLNEDIRTQLNLTVGQHVTKAQIVEYARRYPSRVREWARQQTSRSDLQGYDFEADDRGIVGWDRASTAFAATNPISGLEPPADMAELISLIDRILSLFKHFIEDQRGWSLLYNSNDEEKPEEAAQLLFLGFAQHYLRLFNVELDREVELGRGPVDFKVASGSALRLLIEVKKAHNGKFWNGLEVQLPSYLRSDDSSDGWFVAIRYRNNRASELRIRELPRMVAGCAKRTGKRIRFVAIDARRKLSASNQRSNLQE
jgi:hypothetical protein